MLIYCSFPIMGRDLKPTWVDPLKDSMFVKSQKWTVYDPYLSLKEQPEALKTISTSKVNKVAEDNAALLKINELALSNSPESIQELIRCDDHELSSQIVFKDLFVLMRATVVVTDLNNPSYGGTSQEALYAHIMGIPLIGVCFKMQQSPWMHQRCNSIIAPKNADDIVRAIIGVTSL